MSASPHPTAGFVEVPLDAITVTPGNHRHDLGDLDSLADSIRRIGLVQPITVRPSDNGYELVAGQRRLAAARLAGLPAVPAFVRDLSDVESRKAMAVENLHRKDLGPLEAAGAYQDLLDLGVASDEIALLSGTSARTISDHTALLTLPRKVRRELSTGAISYDTALLLTQLADTPDRLTHALRNARDGWSLSAAVQHELHERELQRKTDSARAELEGRGVSIVERPRESFGRHARMQRLGNGWGCIPITQAKHAKEPCHAAYIESHSGDIVYVCTDVQRHAGTVPGIEVPVDAKAARAAKRAERQAQQRAVDVRRGVITTNLDSMDASVASEHIARVLLVDAEENIASLACTLLGVSTVAGDYHGASRALLDLTRERPDDIGRIALALTLARGEVYLGREYRNAGQDAVVVAHLRYLTLLGYELSEAELALIGRVESRATDCSTSDDIAASE